ncbi:MAG: cell division transport system permease protein [Parcubacteria bacterium C7867-001]|nr:MAG: cell division transport system permease protein [Parcubacteria bacterium C7867-001]
MMLTFRRILENGAKNFYRGGAVSFATVLIMTVTLIIIGSLLFLSAILSNTLASIQDKVDVNVYFVTSASENDIMGVKNKLEQLPEVKSVEYTSRDQALAEFRERHSNDQLTLQALDELGTNPLGASLAIKAKNPSQYEGIVQFLSDEPALSVGGSSIIDRINYYQNKTVIDRLTNALRTTEQAGLVIVLLFAIASIVIVLASMRLAIYTARDEIGVMRLMGASNMYIRGPFIVAAMISGLLAAIITLVLFYPVAWYVGSSFSGWLGGFNLFDYYISHFPLVFLIIVGSGILLGAVASFVAVRRYLKI